MRSTSKSLLAVFVGMVATIAIIPASSAMAAYTATTAIAASNNQAGGHPDLTTTYTNTVNAAARTACGAFCAKPPLDPDAATIKQTLPVGFLADPNATPFCTPASVAAGLGVGTVTTCPADTKIGTEAFDALVCGTGACAGVVGTGQVYNGTAGTTPPAPGTVDPTEQGHLFVLTDPSGPGLPNSQIDLSFHLLRGDTLESVNQNPLSTTTLVGDGTAAALGVGVGGCTDIPANPLSICPLHLTRIAFTQTGATGEGIGHALITAPTACNEGTMTQLATATDSSTSESTATFTATGCDSLAFAPQLDVTLSTSTAGAVPAIDAKVTQNATEAATKSAKIAFPGLFKVSQGSSLVPCGTAEQGTGQTAPTCASSSKLGTATITAPGILSGTTETGDIFLGQGSGSALFNLVANLGGYFPLVARGSTTTDTANNNNVVTEFPDNPLATFASFTQNLTGDTGGILKNPTVCAPMTITGDFTSHSGKTASSSKTVNITDCSAAKAKLSASPNKRGKHPKVTAEASSAGTVLASTQFNFSKGGTVASPNRLKHGASASAAATRVGKLTVTTNSGNGAASTTINLNYKKSKSSSKKVVMAGTLNGVAVTVTVKGKSGPKVTFSGLPSTTDLLTGVKLQLLGNTRKWLTLGSKCRKNKVTTKNTDVYGTSGTSSKKRKCKK